MKVIVTLLVLLTGFTQGIAAGHDPIILTAHQLSIATGKPSLVNMTNGTTYLPVWSLSGGTEGQSVVGLVALPKDCAAVKVEIVVTTDEAAGEPGMEDVYRVHLSQMVENAPLTERYLGNPVRTTVPTKAFVTRTIVLESYRSIVPGAPLSVRIQREPKDPGNTFIRPAGLALVKVTPLPATPKPFIVEDAKGYNSWPMMQAIGDKLVCVYSRGSAHTINEDARQAFARTSSDRGRTWTPETVVANTPGYGEVPVGKEASPPFVTVYAEQDRRRLAEIDREIAAVEEARAREIAPAVARFEQWLADPVAAPELHPDSIGGAVARGPHRSFFADTSLSAGLSFDTPLRGRGSLVVVKADNSDTEVGHFAHAASETALPGVGIAIAEGPRVFAHFAAADGAVLHGEAISAKYGEAYEWSYAYDPGNGNMKRSYHTDGRAGEAKFDDTQVY